MVDELSPNLRDRALSPTPTQSDRVLLEQNFRTIIEALDVAATTLTGVNLYGLRGELVEALSYAELRRAARECAARLLEVGLQPGDRVGLIAVTSGDFVRLFFACQYAGLVPAPLPPPPPMGAGGPYMEQIGRLLLSAQASALLGPPGWDDLYSACMGDMGLAFAGALSHLPAATNLPLPKIAPADASYVQFSSGSTRWPTGVVVTHAALLANAKAITCHGLKVRPADRAVSWLPLYHDMGLVGFLLSPMVVQMSVDLLPTEAFVRRPRLWLELLARNGGTISYSPTFGYELCVKRCPTDGLPDLSAWRVAGVGGDMIRPEALRRFAVQFAHVGFSMRSFVASYGLAEATLALAIAPLEEGLVSEAVDIDQLERLGVATMPPIGGAARAREFVFCGAALPGHELQVRDPFGHVLPEREVGRIYARGPSIMRGYLGQAVGPVDVLDDDGWLDTGDLGYLWKGQIVPTGREKDLIILHGRNIWPQDLEWTVEAEVDGVRPGDALAFSVSDPGGERVIVLVQCRGHDPDRQQLLGRMVERILRLRHSVDPTVVIVGPHALPRTSSGKLSRARARATFLQQQQGPG